jgi:outer membrane immunogenic protein
MTRHLLAAAAIAVAMPAQAADLPVKAPPAAVETLFNWTGFYVGVQGGWGWGSSVQFYEGGSTDRYRISGGHGGGTVGYNMQFGRNIVAGVEADLSAANIKGSGATSANYNCGQPVQVCQTQVSWFATVRGRAGVAVQNALIYGTGGAAFARLKTSLGPPPELTGTSTRSGWTAGGGIEYALNQSVSLKVEYLYLHFGSYRWSSGAVPPGADCSTITCSTDARFSVIRGGLNVRWGGPVVARY